MQIHSTLTLTLIAAALLVGAAPSFAAQAPERFVKTRTQDNFRYYAGTVTLTGKVERRTDSDTLDVLGDKVCFDPTGASTKLIPREKPDDRSPWFCFSDDKSAQKQLGIPSQKPKGFCGYTAVATIVVTDYVVDLSISEVFDEARLVRVVSSQPVGKIPCTH